jgi:hypothetical protein
MAYWTYIPPPPLSDFVDMFWSYEGYDPPHSTERVVPTGTMQLIVNLREDELRVYDRQDHRRFQSLGGSLISGTHSRFVVIDTASQASTLAAVSPTAGLVEAERLIALPEGFGHRPGAGPGPGEGKRDGS